MKLEFTGKGISRGSWESYMSDFERLAAELDIQEEGKFDKLGLAVPRGWMDCILDAECRAHKVVLSGTDRDHRVRDEDDSGRHRHPEEGGVTKERRMGPSVGPDVRKESPPALRWPHVEFCTRQGEIFRQGAGFLS